MNRIKLALLFVLLIFSINACDQRQPVADTNQVKQANERSAISDDSMRGYDAVAYKISFS